MCLHKHYIRSDLLSFACVWGVMPVTAVALKVTVEALEFRVYIPHSSGASCDDWLDDDSISDIDFRDRFHTNHQCVTIRTRAGKRKGQSADTANIALPVMITMDALGKVRMWHLDRPLDLHYKRASSVLLLSLQIHVQNQVSESAPHLQVHCHCLEMDDRHWLFVTCGTCNCPLGFAALAQISHVPRANLRRCIQRLHFVGAGPDIVHERPTKALVVTWQNFHEGGHDTPRRWLFMSTVLIAAIIGNEAATAVNTSNNVTTQIITSGLATLQVTDVSREAAALILGMSPNSVTKVRRKFMSRWPYRKHKQINDLMEKERQYGISSGRVQEANAVCQQLQ